MCKDQVNSIFQLLLNVVHVNIMLMSRNVLNVKSVRYELGHSAQSNMVI